MGLKLDVVLLGHIKGIGGRIEADREDDHLELFLFDTFVVGGITDRHVLGDGVFADDGDVASDEAHIGEVLRSLIVALKVLPVGADIVMEDGALGSCIVVLGQDGLLLGIGTADSGTVAVAAFDDLTGTDTLDPGNLMGMLLVGIA
jgi:hypothetical protein